MTLRLRIALALGSIAAAVSTLAVVGSYAATRAQLRSETDQFLISRVEAITTAFAPRADRRPPLRRADLDDVDDLRPTARWRQLSGLDAVTQFIDGDGDVIARVDSTVTLPVTDVDRAATEQPAPATLRTVVLDGSRYRMATSYVSPGVAVQVARGLDSDAAVLRRLSGQLVLLGGVGALAAAVAGWIFARRTTEPIERLDLSARRVADTQQLDVPVEVTGDAEVASLATSFNTMLAALRSSREQQHRLVMDASHELRTPLTSLRTGVELLGRFDDLPTADRERLLTNLSSELVELSDLVSELVELASDRTSSTEPAVDTTLEPIATSVAERARTRSGRGIHVTVDAPAVVSVHPAMVERAIGNLVDNALKYDGDHPVDIEIRGSTVSVSDRGPGVADADKPHLFERFYRSTEARGMPGSGLGLSIVADIAAHHGAEAGVADREGGGATFTLRFPPAPPSGH